MSTGRGTTSAELMRRAVDRSGGLCCLCGRPCGPGDARRHSEVGPFGDSTGNFSAMCRPCRGWIDESGPPPARYIVHHWQGPAVWKQWLQRLLLTLFLATVAILGLAFLVVAALVLYEARHGGPLEVFGAGLLLVFLLTVTVGLLRGGSGPRAPTQHVHHSFDPQQLDVREGH